MGNCITCPFIQPKRREFSVQTGFHDLSTDVLDSCQYRNRFNNHMPPRPIQMRTAKYSVPFQKNEYNGIESSQTRLFGCPPKPSPPQGGYRLRECGIQESMRPLTFGYKVNQNSSIIDGMGDRLSPLAPLCSHPNSIALTPTMNTSKRTKQVSVNTHENILDYDEDLDDFLELEHACSSTVEHYQKPSTSYTTNSNNSRLNGQARTPQIDSISKLQWNNSKTNTSFESNTQPIQQPGLSQVRTKTNTANLHRSSSRASNLSFHGNKVPTNNKNTVTTSMNHSQKTPKLGSTNSLRVNHTVNASSAPSNQQLLLSTPQRQASIKKNGPLQAQETHSNGLSNNKVQNRTHSTPRRNPKPITQPQKTSPKCNTVKTDVVLETASQAICIDETSACESINISEEKDHPVEYTFYVDDTEECRKPFFDRRISSVATACRCKVFFHARAIGEKRMYFKGNPVRPVTVSAPSITVLRRCLGRIDNQFPHFNARAFLSNALAC